MLLADYRMPQMTGIEFLEHAMDLYPAARRVLLTAYADTDAAIEAINVVDLDYYLLKPWDPPEEKLYPVDRRAARVVAQPPTTVRCRRRRSSATGGRPDRLRCASSWPATRCRTGGLRRTSPRAQACSPRPGRTTDALPVVITPDGDPLVAPSDGELAGRVGLTTTPSKDFYDLIVIGGGPGRASAPPCTAPRRGCARCWSSAPRPAARPGRARGSRTTWASPTASPEPSSPSALGGRPSEVRR